MLNVWCSMHSIQDSNILFAMQREKREQKKRTRKKNVENFTLYALIHLGVFFFAVETHAMRSTQKVKSYV